MSPRITHIDPEETIRKLKAKVDRLEKALAKQPAQQALDKMAENARELGIQMQPARPYRLLQDNGSKYFGESWDKAEQPAQQEPVAWGVDWGKAGDIPCVSIIKRLHSGGIEVVAVEYAPYSYTSPPAQRTWVGLTIGEIQDLIQFKEHSPFALAEDIEAKLKEKNNG